MSKSQSKLRFRCWTEQLPCTRSSSVTDETGLREVVMKSWWNRTRNHDKGRNGQKSRETFFLATVRYGFKLENGQHLAPRYFNPLSIITRLRSSSCTVPAHSRLPSSSLLVYCSHAQSTSASNRWIKENWRGVIVQVYTPGDDLSVIPLRTSSIWSSSMTTCFALPICPSFGGLLDCEVPKNELVSCNRQLKDIWPTSLSAP